ncbi:MAG: AAA family ATPase [Planctomycetota bacterium]
MSKPVEYNVILKYCEIVDEFIKVRVFSDDDIGGLLEVSSVPNKRAYQQLVVNACVVNYEEEVVPLFKKFSRVYKPEALAELLYQICVEVNPHLEIHQVSLPLAEDDPVIGKLQLTRDGASSGKDDRRRIIDIEKDLNERIIGQEEAVAAVAKAVKKASVGLKDPRKPIGVFLLVGTTGIGKTELAKVVARHLFGDLSKLVRVDCSEYALPHEYAKLIGAPPGYIGHNEGGYLTEAVKERKACVVLFDEVEKAHFKLHNLLLQVMDEGFLTDSKGAIVPFNRSLIFLTSNVGVDEINAIRNRMGFDCKQREHPSGDDARDAFHEAAKNTFRPEFLNRLDDIIVFNTLTLRDCVQIAALQLKEVAGYLLNSGIQLSWSPRVEQYVAEAGFSREYGARELRRIIKSEIEDPLSERIIDARFKPGDHVDITLRRNRLVFELPRKTCRPKSRIAVAEKEPAKEE